MNRRKMICLVAGGLAVVTAGIGSLVALPSVVLFLLRRRLPESITEPSSAFRIGSPLDFAVGVDTRFLQSHRVCVVRNTNRLYVLFARCTHQGCTPDWVVQENKFRCPCHGSRFCLGSAFDGDGINCEGPAPRPLDRVDVEINSEGQVVANTAKLYQWPKRERSQFDDPGAYIPLTQG